MISSLFAALVAVAILPLAQFAAAASGVVGFSFHKRSDVQTLSPARIRKRAKTESESITWGDLLYYINITLGTPGQGSAVWLDTGSSDLWIPDYSSSICEGNDAGCSNNGGFSPDESSSYEVVSGEEFQISYASGDRISGDYGKDTLQLDSVKIEGMYFGVASRGRTTTPLNGIFGIGYPLGESLVTNSEVQRSPYPNLISQLVSQGFINSRTYSLYLNDLDNGHGTILFGGVDSAKYTGELGIVDVQPNSETDSYDTFTVVLAGLSFTANGATSNIDLDGGLPVILDSGTTLTYLPDDIAQSIYDGLGILSDPEAGPIVPCNADTSGMKFTFTFGGPQGVAISVDVSQFVVPYNAAAGLPSIRGEKACTFGIYPTGTVANGAGDILFGDTFLRSAYVVYDLDNNQIGLAQVKFDASDSNIKEIGSSSTQTTNMIPGATTVTGGATISQTNTQQAQPTELFTAVATSTTAVDGDAGAATSHSATFAGISGGLKSSSSSSSSSSSMVMVPLLDFTGLSIGLAMVLGFLIGSSLFLVV